VYDAGETDGSPFIVMELVAGDSLHDRRPEALDDILAIARQVCAALEHVYASGIIHPDPASLLRALSSAHRTVGEKVPHVTDEGGVLGRRRHRAALRRGA